MAALHLSSSSGDLAKSGLRAPPPTPAETPDSFLYETKFMVLNFLSYIPPDNNRNTTHIQSSTSSTSESELRKKLAQSSENRARIFHASKLQHRHIDATGSPFNRSPEKLKRLKLKKCASNGFDRNSNIKSGDSAASRDQSSALQRCTSEISSCGDGSYNTDADDEFEDTSANNSLVSSFSSSGRISSLPDREETDLLQVVDKLPTILSVSDFEGDWSHFSEDGTSCIPEPSLGNADARNETQADSSNGNLFSYNKNKLETPYASCLSITDTTPPYDNEAKDSPANVIQIGRSLEPGENESPDSIQKNKENNSCSIRRGRVETSSTDDAEASKMVGGDTLSHGASDGHLIFSYGDAATDAPYLSCHSNTDTTPPFTDPSADHSQNVESVARSLVYRNEICNIEAEYEHSNLPADVEEDCSRVDCPRLVDRSHLFLDVSNEVGWERRCNNDNISSWVNVLASLQEEVADEMTALESEVEDAIRNRRIESIESPFCPLTPETELAVFLARVGDEIQEEYETRLNEAVRNLIIMQGTGPMTYKDFSAAISAVMDVTIPGWRQVILFMVYSKKLALGLLKSGHSGIGNLVDYTAQLIFDNAASFIINQGGWIAAANSLSSGSLCSSDSSPSASPGIEIGFNRMSPFNKTIVSIECQHETTTVTQSDLSQDGTNKADIENTESGANVNAEKKKNDVKDEQIVESESDLPIVDEKDEGSLGNNNQSENKIKILESKANINNAIETEASQGRQHQPNYHTCPNTANDVAVNQSQNTQNRDKIENASDSNSDTARTEEDHTSVFDTFKTFAQHSRITAVVIASLVIGASIGLAILKN